MCEIEETQIQHEKVFENTQRLFNPPLYLQRYDAVIGAIVNNKELIKSVADLGCSEGNLLRYYKPIADLEKIIAVDIDDYVLCYANRRIEPIVADYIMGRTVQLDVYIYQGDICKPDPRLIGIDAISCVEVIEHMEEDKVDQLVDCIFGIYKPKLVAITTPNIEFNVIFGNKEPKFRHYDHKFEWTRAQFLDWCDRVIAKYPDYKYEITGVGLPTKDYPSVGYASQIAYFRPLSTNFDRRPIVDTNLIQETYRELWHHTIEQKQQQPYIPFDWGF